MVPKVKQLVINALFRESQPEIDEHTMKLIVGLIAFLLPFLTNYFSDGGLSSISASYHADGWSRDIFVGCLFAISAFLMSYNGKPPLPGQNVLGLLDQVLISQWSQKLLSKIAAFAAIGVAIFPCRCGCHDEIIPGAHAWATFFMFAILSVFCFVFFRRARFKYSKAVNKAYSQARKRAVIYAICGLWIIGCIASIGLYSWMSEDKCTSDSSFIFWAEFTALMAFGVSWFTASQIIIFKHDDKVQ